MDSIGHGCDTGIRCRSSSSSIRAKAPPRPFAHVDLETGSLLVMEYSTQIHYTHGVAKTSATSGERISLAFRVKPDQQPPKANGDGGGDRDSLA